MKQVLVRQGTVAVEEVPVPGVEPGTLLVRVDHSCISAGTEMSGVKSAGTPLWKRALRRPQAVMKVVEMAATQGISRTRHVIEGKLTSGSPTGYSAAGTVIDVGDGVDDLHVGDRVACAGAQCAHHAEVIRAPRNLVARVPEGLSLAPASTVTLGAIALQGVRRASPTLGETFVVIGLGLLGQLVSQLLKANGCRVIGTDLDSERIKLAESLGVDVGIRPGGGTDIEQIVRLTDGIGADGVIITAATPSNDVVSTAFKMCRKKGRVVLVGDVGLTLNRADFYAKELDFFISTSYGPGRYDRSYEEEGCDYPVAYVRWTENRNMTEYLRLLADGAVNVAPLIDSVVAIENAADAYASLEPAGGSSRPLIVLLQYPESSQVEGATARIVANRLASPARAGAVRLAVVGAGNFAKGMHLPNLQSLGELYSLRAIVSRSGHNATAVARQFGAGYATTDYQAVLADPEIDAVLIATRHHHHAAMVLEGLRAGKHVVVEKPLALSGTELTEISAFYESVKETQEQPILLTGFNRRFSPHTQLLSERVRNRTNPLILNYRMNAGYIPLDAWVHGAEGGGRNIGEACHIYDLFVFLTGSRAVDVVARTIRPETGYYTHHDNFVATVTFADGSLATLTYTALGTREHPKESLESFVDGQVLVLDDYRKTEIRGHDGQGLRTKTIEKGHSEELKRFAQVIQQGGEWPIPLWQQFEATQISFRVEREIRANSLGHTPASLIPEATESLRKAS